MEGKMTLNLNILNVEPNAISKNIKDLLNDNQIEKALQLSGENITRHPKDPVILINHAMVNLAALRLQDAIEYAIKSHKYDETSIRPFTLIARALILSEDFREALKYASRAHEIEPSAGEPQLLIGVALSRLKVHLDSEVWLSKAIDSGSLSQLQLAEARFYRSQELLALGHNEDVVLQTVNDAIKHDPDNANYIMGLGNILSSFGRTVEAQKAFDLALQRAPLMGSLYWNKSRSLRFTSADFEFIARMQDLYVNAEMRDVDRVLLGFSLAKAYRDLGAYEQAFDCWETANSVQKLMHSFDFRAEQMRFISYYRDFPIKTTGSVSVNETGNPTPIFIVGMPRSGTTLAEQIIGSHSRVTPLGELEYLARAIGVAQKNFVNLHDKEALDYVREYYFKEIRRHDIKTEMFTDKMPLNFRFLPIIAHAFPEARIVHCNRDAMAVCFSNFSNYFPAEGMVFSCNQTDVAEYYKIYEQYMALMSSVFSERMYELQYAILTEDQLSETNRLLIGCGLSFESSCIDFNKTTRAIATASQRQIRRGMYKGSTDEWRKFSQWLGPMMASLKTQGSVSSQDTFADGSITN
jgi:tetratricopeptide (TPR) repeat protein